MAARVRETGRPRLTDDCYHWYHVKYICDTPLRQPQIHQLLKTNSIHGPWFIQWVPTGVSHISLRTQELQPREWEKKTNEQYGLWSAPSARRVVLWHFFVQLFVYLVDYHWACIFRETPTEAIRNADSSLTVFFTASFCWPLSTLEC